MNENPILSIVILNYKTPDKIRVCLSSIYNNLNNLPLEVIVIENGSNDGSDEIIAREFPLVNLIINKENNFFAAGNNQGFKVAKGKYILMLNSDTEITKDVIEKMILFMEDPINKNVGGCTCNIYYPNGTSQNYNRKNLTLLNFIIRFIILEKNFIRKIFPEFYNYLYNKVYYNNLKDEKINNEPIEADVLMGIAILFQKDVIDKINGFDEKYKLYFTDDEICDKIRKNGYKLFSLPYDKIIHHHSESIKKLTNANKILDEDAYKYIKNKFNWGSFIVAITLYKIDRFLLRVYRTIIGS